MENNNLSNDNINNNNSENLPDFDFESQEFLQELEKTIKEIEETFKNEDALREMFGIPQDMSPEDLAKQAEEAQAELSDDQRKMFDDLVKEFINELSAKGSNLTITPSSLGQPKPKAKSTSITMPLKGNRI